MKRFILNSTSRIPVLKIVIDLYDAMDQSVAASEEIDFKKLKHPSIKKRFKHSDDWLMHVNDLARSILSSIKARKFKITRLGCSKKSYTYYFRFFPVDRAGNVINQELELQIELRDHVSKTHEDICEITPELAIKTYYLNGKTYDDMVSILLDVRHILDQLQEGDFTAFGR